MNNNAIMYEFIQLLEENDLVTKSNPREKNKVYGPLSLPIKCQLLQNELKKYSGLIMVMGKSFYDCIKFGYTSSYITLKQH